MELIDGNKIAADIIAELNGLYGAGISPQRYLHYLSVGGDRLASAFQLFADEENYPFLVHCTAGKDRTGVLLHWIEVGQPDDRRLAKACGRADRVTVYTYAASTPVWWKAIADKLARLSNLTVWQIETTASQALAAMANRSMQLQVTVQDGVVWVSDGTDTVELQPQALKTATR